MTPAEKQRLIRDLVVEHPQFTQSLGALERFHFPVKGGLPARGNIAALIGDSRTGKTFATKAYASRFSPSVGKTGVRRQVLYVDMPHEGGGGLKGILQAFAHALDLTISLRMNNPLLTRLVLNALQAQGVELVLLDEFDQVFRENNKPLLGAGRGLIRKIADLGSLSIVCIGLRGAYDLLKEDTQIVGRGGLPFTHLRPYGGPASAEWLTFRKICDAFDQAMPFEHEARLGAVDFASRLHWVTQGNIGHLKFYIEAAANEALSQNAERLERAHFATAYDVRKPLGQVFNPFHHDLTAAPNHQSGGAELKRGAARTVFSKKAEPSA